MNSNVAHSSVSDTHSPSRGLLLLATVYVAGNLAVFALCRWLIGIDLRLAHLAPILFLVVPAVDLFIGIRMRLTAESYRFRGLTVAILAICFLTWAVFLFVYLKNVFPEAF